MKRWPQWSQGPGGLALLLIAIGVPTLMIVRVDSGDGSQSGAANAVILAVLLVLVGLAAIQLGRMLAGADPAVAELSSQLADDPEQARLLARWLSRARWARNIGGLCGVVVWVLGTQGQGDLLAWGVGGIATGALLAEVHHVRRSAGPRTASLDVRSLNDYLPVHDRRRMIVVAALAGAVALAGLAAGSAAVWFGLAAVAVLGAARLAQWRVAARPRPALSDTLRTADDMARHLAIGRGLARPATYLSLALISRGAWALEPTIGGGAALLAVAAWLYAFYMWWTNRRLGLDHLLKRSQPAGA